MAHSRPLFRLFSFFSHDKYSTNTINDKCIDGVLGTRTREHRMVGADNSTDLLRHPSCSFICRTRLDPSFTEQRVDQLHFNYWPNCKTLGGWETSCLIIGLPCYRLQYLWSTEMWLKLGSYTVVRNSQGQKFCLHAHLILSGQRTRQFLLKRLKCASYFARKHHHRLFPSHRLILSYLRYSPPI